MTLKEAFHYQNYLEKLMTETLNAIQPRNAIQETRIHKRNASNPEAQDAVEEVPRDVVYPMDAMIRFAHDLISQKYMLTREISRAKANSDNICLDAEIEANKYRQRLAANLTRLLAKKPEKSIVQGRGYKLDINQVQVPYYYDIEIVQADAFDRPGIREDMRSTATLSNEVSLDIEREIVTLTVDYDPPYPVDASFDEVMEEYTK